MQRLRRWFPVCWQDGVTLVVLMVVALDISLLLQPIGADANHASLIYVLAVFLVSRFTNGYLYGTLASILSVVIVNYVFFYPYFSFGFQVVGYPLTFFTMFSVSIMTSILISHIRAQENIRIEAERERLRANLLRAVGHDLRTPLTSIMGSASAMLEHDSLSPPEKRHLLENIYQESEWMVRMVENLLSITKVGSDSFQLQKQPEAVEEIVGEGIAKFQARFPQINVEAAVPEEWLEVPMDGMLIEQVLYNLMENAAIHGHANQICIKVSRHSHFAQFSVGDNGLGLPGGRELDSDLASVSTGQNGQKHNMGIGLLVCRDIVKAHGGTFSARTQKRGGAEFSFTLPLEELNRTHEHQRQDPGDRRREKH